MKLSQRLKYAWSIVASKKGEYNKIANTKQLPFTLPMWWNSQEIPPLIDYQAYVREGYKQNAVVHACIRTIAGAAPMAKMVVEREVNGQREVVRDHWLNLTFQNPNPHMSEFEFKELIHTYLNIAGECFLIKVRLGGKRGWSTGPGEFYVPRPDMMRPILGRRSIKGYVHTSTNGEKTPFEPGEVVHIKYPNPDDPLEGFGRGLSPLSAAARITDIDNRTTAIIDNFFKKGAMVAGLLKLKHRVTNEDEFEYIRRRLLQQYTSDEKNFYDMILDADAEYQRIGLNFDEMALPELRSLTESRICSIFKVPAILVGVQVGMKHEGGFTTAIPEARKALWQDKIVPDNMRIADAMTMGLASMLEENEFITFDYSNVEALQENRDSKFKRADMAWNSGWMTKNEARIEAGLPGADDGDSYKADSLPVATGKSVEVNAKAPQDLVPSPGD